MPAGRALILSSWQRLWCCAYKPSCHAKSPRPNQLSSPSAYCKPALRKTLSPDDANIKLTCGPSMPVFPNEASAAIGRTSMRKLNPGSPRPSGDHSLDALH